MDDIAFLRAVIDYSAEYQRLLDAAACRDDEQDARDRGSACSTDAARARRSIPAPRPRGNIATMTAMSRATSGVPTRSSTVRTPLSCTRACARWRTTSAARITAWNALRYGGSRWGVQELGADPRGCALIGDSARDISGARNAKTLSLRRERERSHETCVPEGLDLFVPRRRAVVGPGGRHRLIARERRHRVRARRAIVPAAPIRRCWRGRIG